MPKPKLPKGTRRMKLSITLSPAVLEALEDVEGSTVSAKIEKLLRYALKQLMGS